MANLEVKLVKSLIGSKKEPDCYCFFPWSS